MLYATITSPILIAGVSSFDFSDDTGKVRTVWTLKFMDSDGKEGAVSLSQDQYKQLQAPEFFGKKAEFEATLKPTKFTDKNGVQRLGYKLSLMSIDIIK